MKVRELLAEERFEYQFQSKNSGLAQLMKTLMMSPIHVEAHYNDWRTIGEDTDDRFKKFFDGVGGERVDMFEYHITLKSTKELKVLIDAAQAYFHDEGQTGDPDLEWPFAFTVKAEG